MELERAIMKCGGTIFLAAGSNVALTAYEPRYDYVNDYLLSDAKPNPNPQDFFVCHGYGCKYTNRIALRDEEWREVSALISRRLLSQNL
jgi:hypothetical protein